MFKRTRINTCALLALGSALMFSAPVFAQGSEGSLSGQAAASTIASNVAVSGASQTWIVADGAGANDLAVSGIVSGSGPIIKSGANGLTLSNANTFTGTLDFNT